jgi:DNA invertase Pin-like site-specific DNA recombinase
MLHSLSAQISYYSEYIQRRNEWIFAGVFADEAYTGTKDERPQFQRLLDECRAGKVDLVLAKSISRFARNTLTLLSTVRELKSLDVDVYFERENIHSMSGDGELMLSILAAFAQEESLSVSENCKWRIRDKFKEGIPVGFYQMYGYKLINGEMTINESQAAVIRIIFEDYVNGLGTEKIAAKLNSMKIPAYHGGEWCGTVVCKLLKNEKLIGDSLLQKRYSTDHLTKRRVKNHGQLEKYYSEETHPQIIDKELFAKAQEIRENRRKQSEGICPPTIPYPFTGKVECSICGKNYKRITVHHKAYWQCSTYQRLGKKVCAAKRIPEETLYKATAEVLGLEEFDLGSFETISKIVVKEQNLLLFEFKDGHTAAISWKDHSCRESWTPEKREAARNKTLERNGKK